MPEITTMNTNVEISGCKDSNPAGRYLKALQDFSPGSLISSFTSPLIAVPESPRMLQVCSNCLSLPHLASDPSTQASSSLALLPSSHTYSPPLSSKPVQACTGCKKVAYCSQNCQRADWKRVHKAECPVFARVAAEQSGKTLPTVVRAALQVMLRWSDMKGKFDQLRGNERELRTDAQAYADVTVQALAVTEYAGLARTDGRGVDYWAEIVRSVLCKIRTNAFHRLDPDYGQDGIVLDPVLAMVNHSCVPNAFVYFFGRNAYLKAERPIAKGEQICISYIDYTTPRYYRHSSLESYYFKCQCARCEGDMDSYDICKTCPTVPLNIFSLQPDLSLYQPGLSSDKVSKSAINDMHRAFTRHVQSKESTRLQHLQKHWRACKPLRDAGLFAIQPLPEMISEIMTRCLEESRFTHSLCIAAFLATRVEPFLYPHPFAQPRLKTCLAIAKLCVNILFDQMERPDAWVNQHVPFHDRLRTTFRTNIDPILITQAMLIMVTHYGPMAHDERWDVLLEAKSILAQYESRADREELTAGLAEWQRSPASDVGKNIFEFMIGKSLRLLADFALEVLDYEVGC